MIDKGIFREVSADISEAAVTFSPRDEISALLYLPAMPGTRGSQPGLIPEFVRNLDSVP